MGHRVAVVSETVTRNLIEQTGQGNQKAFEELCRRYDRRLFGVAFNVLANADLANEVMQDIRLAIWQNSSNYKGDSKPFTWMFAIARHKAISALRSNLRPARYANGEFDSVLKEKPEVDRAIGEALEKLSPEHRLVVILTYYLNLSQSHISELMQCPVGTVKSRLSHALRRLRELWNTPLRLESLQDSAQF